jgi:hypothetical protein
MADTQQSSDTGHFPLFLTEVGIDPDISLPDKMVGLYGIRGSGTGNVEYGRREIVTSEGWVPPAFTVSALKVEQRYHNSDADRFNLLSQYAFNNANSVACDPRNLIEDDSTTYDVYWGKAPSVDPTPDIEAKTSYDVPYYIPQSLSTAEEARYLKRSARATLALYLYHNDDDPTKDDLVDLMTDTYGTDPEPAVEALRLLKQEVR